MGDCPAPADAGFYWIAIVLRMLAQLYLAGIVVRDILRPEHDPVRRSPIMADAVRRQHVESRRT